MAVSGVALGAIAVGTVFVYGGLTNRSPLAAILAVVKGQNANTVPQAVSATGQDSSSGSGSNSGSGASGVANTGSAQSIFKATAAQFGWDTGAEWSALNNVEMKEARFNPKARNSSSGALGIAQALDHGNSNTAGTLGNEYGGYGLSDAQAKLANSGDAAMQSLWMMNYIKDRYGDPIAAWAQYHHADGSKWY